MTIGTAKLTAQVIEKTVSEVSKQQVQVNQVSEGGSPFKQMMDSMSSGQDFASKLGYGGNEVGLGGNQVNAISAEGFTVDQATANVGVGKPEGMNTVVNMLSEVNNGQMHMDNLMNEILYSGKRFSNQELLAIQAQVFQHAQITELVVKAADQGVSSIKSVLNTNIQ